MKKIILAVLFLTSIFSILDFAPVLAQTSSVRQDTFDQLGSAAGAASLGNPTDPREIAARIIRTALTVIGTIFLVLTVYAGFLWMTAGGEEENASKAKKLLYNAVIGLAIVLAAYSITIFVFGVVLDGSTGSNNGSQNTNAYCVQNPLDPNCAQ